MRVRAPSRLRKVTSAYEMVQTVSTRVVHRRQGLWEGKSKSARYARVKPQGERMSTSAFVIACTSMATLDLGIAYTVYRIYRWASTPEARQAHQPATRQITRRQAAADLA